MGSYSLSDSNRERVSCGNISPVHKSISKSKQCFNAWGDKLWITIRQCGQLNTPGSFFTVWTLLFAYRTSFTNSFE